MPGIDTLRMLLTLILLPTVSSLMKLSDKHACESFVLERRKQLNEQEISVARTLNRQCLQIMKETTDHILVFIKKMNESIQNKGSDFAPWWIDCVYQTAATLAWMGSDASAQDSQKYALALSLCRQTLQRINDKWSVAGKF